MKVILLRDKGRHLSLNFSRQRLAVLSGLLATALFVGGIYTAHYLAADRIDAEVVAQWRAKLAAQRDEVSALERKSQAQSVAVGRQLAEMQARLLRMEALGAHMTDAADLESEEFDFDTVPAQGGPVQGNQRTLAWHELSTELLVLSDQIKRRERELSILDEVLVNEDMHSASQVRGRPVTWGWLSSPYGKRVDPITGKTAWHSGVDFAGRDGSDVIAVASGVVTYAGERYGYGKLVEISHADGLVTRYAHHKTLSVSTGDVVKKGEAIGTMGSTGRSTGPHVHFEVLKNGRTVDPAAYVSRRS